MGTDGKRERDSVPSFPPFVPFVPAIMCGRIDCHHTPEEIEIRFQVPRGHWPDRMQFEPSYNRAPMQPCPVVTWREEGRWCQMMQWGLLPSWAKIGQKTLRPINARCETLEEKAMYRSCLPSCRCLVVVSGWFEWLKESTTPFHIRSFEDQPMALAGLYQVHQNSDSKTQHLSFTVITTSASPALAWLHDRMPVVLEEDHWATWLGETKEEAMALLKPYEGDLKWHCVERKWVGNLHYTGAKCIEPVREEGPGITAFFRTARGEKREADEDTTSAHEKRRACDV